MDPFTLIVAERRRLADALADLSPGEWAQPSLCGAWSNHEVAAHLNVPFCTSSWGFLVAMVKARGNFDQVNERLATDLAREMGPKACVEGLRANATNRWTPPGYGPEAPLTDVLVHGEDILRPLGRSLQVSEHSLSAVLHFMTSRKADRGFGVISIDDVHFEPTDVDVSIGHGGQVVTGPAMSMIGVLLRRRTFLDDLSGPGADLLRTRV